jgi:2-hydroxy-3-oxopropionate reductase
MPQYARRRRHPGERLIALMGARNVQMNLPLIAITQQLMNACASLDSTGWKHSATVQALEQLANFEIGQKSGHEALG